MHSNDLSKELLYEAVKAIYDCDHKHIHLSQQKLFTLYSAAFNYMLYKATKEPGHYIIRVQDSYLFDKLAKKSKDETTRKFMQKLSLPRRMKYQNSTFHLDFFNISTWMNTNELPKEKIKGALIVKNTSAILQDTPLEDNEADMELNAVLKSLPKDYYVSTLTSFVPKVITIAFGESFEDSHVLKFNFIKDIPREELLRGVKINVDLDSLED